MSPYRRGDRVLSLRWTGAAGQITRVRHGRIFVRWDGTNFEDEVSVWEIAVPGGDWG
jgi:hypothetical protein